jgi:hypothetical protein
MLSLWRRHTEKCPHREKGRAWTKCACPIWCDGEVAGVRVRESLDTRDWGRAGRKAAALEGERETGRIRRTVGDAATAFLNQCSVESSTFKKYSRWLDSLTTYATSNGARYVDEIGLEFLDGYRMSRTSAR